MTFKIAFLFLFSLIQSTLATSVWSGWVYDKASKAPVSGALVTAASGSSATTDAKGYFELNQSVAGFEKGRSLAEGWNPASQTLTATLAAPERVDIEVRDLEGRLVARPQTGILPAGQWIWSPMYQVNRSGPLFVRLVRNGKTQTWSVMNSGNRGNANRSQLVVKMAGREAGATGDTLAVSAAGYLPAKFWADPSKSVLDTFWLQSAAGIKFAIRWNLYPASAARVAVSGDTLANYGETRKMELAYDRVLWKLDSLRLNGSLLSPRDTFTFAGINENKTLDFWLSSNYRLPSNDFYRFIGHATSTTQPNLVNVLFQVLDSAGYGVTSLDTGNFATPLVDGKVGSGESWFRIQKSRDIKYSYRFALLLDNSSSLNPIDLERLKAAAAKVVDNMFAGQQIAVWKVSGTAPTLVQNYTNDKALLKAGIAAILPSEVTGTPLYQSVITGVNSLGNFYSQDSVSQGSVLLFTDGRNEGGSSTMAQAIAVRGQIPVYGILLANDPVNNTMNRRSLDSLQNMGGSISVDKADLLESAMLDIQERNLRYTKSFYRLIYATSEVGNSNAHKVYIGLKSNTNHGTDSALTNSFSSAGLVLKIVPVVSQLAPTWGTGTSLKVGDTLRVGYTFQNVNGMYESSIVTGAYTVSDSSRITWYSGSRAIGIGRRYSVKQTDLDSQIHVEILPLAGRVYNFNGQLISRDTGLLVRAWLPFLVSAPKDTVVQDSSLAVSWEFGPNGVCQSFSVDDSTLPCLTSASYRRTFRFTKDTVVHKLKAIDQWGNVIAHSFTAILGIVKPVVFSPAGGVYTSYQKVTLTSATAGDSIYYTTNGTVPTKASNLYLSPISVTSNLTLRAIAIKSGWKNSDTTRAVFTINVVEKPRFSLASGTYTSNQSLTLTTGTTGATIYYTLDGTIPDTTSNKYTSPISVTGETTIKAIAVRTGWGTSVLDSGKYVIQIAAKPVFSLASGTYSAVQTVSLSTATDSAKIYYTVNGTTPTTASILYTGPIAVNTSTTIKALVMRTGWGTSAMDSGKYEFQLLKPVFSVPSGTYTTVQSVTLSTTTDSARIYYTVDGRSPTTASTLYTGPISVNVSKTIKAVVMRTGWGTSAEDSGKYVIQIATKPVFSLASGTYTSVQTLALSTTMDSARIYYTVDGTTPSNASILYTGPIAVNTSKTIKALVMRVGWGTSAMDSGKYDFQLLKPVFSIPSGTYTTAQSVTLSTTTDSARIYYTVDGTLPTSASTLYTGPISVNVSKTIKAVVMRAGWGTSAVDSARYVIVLKFTDARDGTSYKSIVIGNRTWMAENLNYKSPGADSGICYNNSVDSCAKYGRLYTWTEVMGGALSSTATPSGIKGLCPSGWHLPSDAEWDTLATAVGGAGTAGTMLKTVSGWTPNTGKDAWGFGCLPAGGTMSGVGFVWAGLIANFWSTSEYNAIQAWYRSLESTGQRMVSNFTGKSSVSSVRCIKD